MRRHPHALPTAGTGAPPVAAAPTVGTGAPPVAPGAVARERDVVALLRAAGCVFAQEEARLLIAAAPGPDELAAAVGRRIAGEPLETVLGWAEFAGLRVAVAEGVFVPRRRTELLAREAARLAAEAAGVRSATAEGPAAQAVPARLEARATPVVVELCCGVAAVSAVVARDVDPVVLWAVDIDPVAVACAARNLGGRGEARCGDLADPLPGRLRGTVDVLVANAPYVPSGEIATMPREARDREPRRALDGGRDGLDVQRRIVRIAPDWLGPAGHLLVETGERQAAATAALMTAVGLRAQVTGDPEIGATVVVGSRPPGP